MASAMAVLQHLKDAGPALQQNVNDLTASLQNNLNTFFDKEDVPVKMDRFGSLFRFESYGKYSQLFNPVEMQLMFYLMIEKGIYTWERRICFLSAEHTKTETDRIISAVKESVITLKENGFFLDQEGVSGKSSISN
jgi:microcystin synthetase protein McyE